MRRQYFDYRPRTQFTVRGDRLEQMVWEQVRPLLEDPSRVADEYRRRISQAKGEADPPEQVARLDRQITKIQRGIDRLIDCYAGGYIEKAEFEPRIAGLKLRRSQLEEQKRAAIKAANSERELSLVVSRCLQRAPIWLSRRLSSRWPNRRLALLAERTREAANRGPRFGRTNPRNRDRCQAASGGLVRPSRHISSARQQLGNRDVLVDFVPVQANARELDPRALCRACKQKARKACERDAERAAIAQLNPHRVLVKVHRHGREVHASAVSCTPWCRRRCRISGRCRCAPG
jgi:hypothetical protein